MKATVSTINNKFVVTSETPLKGRGIKPKTTSQSNIFKYLVTQKAFDKLNEQYDIDFYNSYV